MCVYACVCFRFSSLSSPNRDTNENKQNLSLFSALCSLHSLSLCRSGLKPKGWMDGWMDGWIKPQRSFPTMIPSTVLLFLRFLLLPQQFTRKLIYVFILCCCVHVVNTNRAKRECGGRKRDTTSNPSATVLTLESNKQKRNLKA